MSAGPSRHAAATAALPSAPLAGSEALVSRALASAGITGAGGGGGRRERDSRMQVDDDGFTTVGGRRGAGGRRGGSGHQRASNPYSGARPSRGRPDGPSQPGSSRRNGPGGSSGANGNGNSKSEPRKPTAGGEKKESESIKKLREWMRGRVVAPGVLDLSNMQGDPRLEEWGIYPPGHPKALAQMGEVMWKMARHLEGVHIHTLSLRGNRLNTLRQLHNLPLHLPHITALDLSENEGIANIKELDVICGRADGLNNRIGGLKELQEIKLDGLALRKNMIADHSEKFYVREMLNRFPNLALLDGVPIPRINFDVKVCTPAQPIGNLHMSAMQAQAFEWPLDVAPGYRDTPEVEAFVVEFLGKFFSLWDNDRSHLQPAYAPDATLSVSALTVPSPRGRVENYHYTMPNQTKLSWNPYLEAPSRNLARTGNDKRIKSLVRNQGAALDTWMSKTLPATRHPLHEQDKWAFDAVDLGITKGVGRVLLTVHGEFQELPSEGYRSFSRNFVLAIAPPGSPAQLAGWNAIILSDSLSVRGYSGNTAFSQSLAVSGASIFHAAPIAQTVAPPVGDMSMIPPDIQAMSDKSPQQMLVIAQVQQQTNLQTFMAVNCAEAAAYDLAEALRKFQELRANIPPDAFRG